MLLVTFSYANPTAAAPRNFLKKIVKNVTLFIFLSILYMQAKERTNRAGRIGESGDCSLWVLAYVTGFFYAGACWTPPFVEARQEKHRLEETRKIKSYFGIFVSVTSFLYNK